MPNIPFVFIYKKNLSKFVICKENFCLLHYCGFAVRNRGPFHKSSYERFLLYEFVEPVLNYGSNEFVALKNLCETGPCSLNLTQKFPFHNIAFMDIKRCSLIAYCLSDIGIIKV